MDGVVIVTDFVKSRKAAMLKEIRTRVLNDLFVIIYRRQRVVGRVCHDIGHCLVADVRLGVVGIMSVLGRDR